MKILVTGAGGFIGKNLIWTMKNNPDLDIMEYHHSQGVDVLQNYCSKCEIVFHLAGVNRPKDEAEFVDGNVNFTSRLVDLLEAKGNTCPIIYASSTQAELDNAYGKSKRQAEEILLDYGQKYKSMVRIYRLPNVFGKWTKPNYNSAIATFCHNIARSIPIHVDSPAREMHLVYVDDFVAEMLSVLNSKIDNSVGFYEVPVSYRRKLGYVVDTIASFADCRGDLSVPNEDDDLTRKLHSTYMSYLPIEKLSYDLIEHRDERGLFAEFVRTKGQGQFSVNVVKPGHLKGNHWHNSKHEKFLIINGYGRMKLRKVDTSDVKIIDTSGEKLKVVDIPPGYTHNIKNVGESDLIVLIWSNENFDSSKPDTFTLEV